MVCKEKRMLYEVKQLCIKFCFYPLCYMEMKIGYFRRSTKLNEMKEELTHIKDQVKNEWVVNDPYLTIKKLLEMF